MERMPWFKWWDGTAADPKLRMIAEECDVSVAVVLGIWAYLLEKASNNEDRGYIGNIERKLMNYTLKLSGETVETVCNGFKSAGLVTADDYINKWDDRQAKRENQEAPGSSTERVRALRERRKAAAAAALKESNGGNESGNDETDETTSNDTKRPKKKNREDEDSKPKPSSSSGDDGGKKLKPFDQFWEAWPHKVGKKDAEKAWTKIKPDVGLLQTILEAIETQKAGHAWMRDGGEYIPHPATWLNGGRWLDEVKPYTPPPVRRATDSWWESKEAMEAKGRSLNPPVLPQPGDTVASYRSRINEALERGDTPAPIAMPTPYTPPLPVGGESVLTDEQLAARRQETRDAIARMKGRALAPAQEPEQQPEGDNP